MCKDPKIVGGIGDINFGKQYRQGNRIYDSNACAMAIVASPLGNLGGYSYLYLVREKKLNKEQKNRIGGKATCRIIGCMDNTLDHTFESANRVYDSSGIAPTIPTCAGGGIQPKVIVRIE